MMRTSVLSTLTIALSSVSAVYQGFNYGSTYNDGSAILQAGFENYFTTAKNLVGHADAFTSARLYTMIQAGTSNSVIEAIPAAINTETSLLLGLWASAGQDDFNNELAALEAAITQYGTAFTDLVVGISIGSEDLYRISPTGILNKSGAGADPSTLVSYIQQVRSLIAGYSAAASLTVGHVDTWTAWVNGSNDAVIENCDWLGMDAYPYFQTTIDNSIEVGNETFFEALDNTIGASMGKPVFVTETGWPVSGPTENLAVASVANAQTYWDEVACTLLGNTNTWWYTLQDAYPTTPSPSFGLVGTTLSTTPLFNLTCPAGTTGSTSSSSSSSVQASTTASVATFSASSASLISTDTSIFGTASPTSVVLTSSATPAEPTTATSGASASAPVSVGSSPTASPVTSVPVSESVSSNSQAPETSSPGAFTSVQGDASVTASVSATASAATESAVAASTTQPAVSTTSATTCTTDILSGSFEYPHLLVPVSSAEPSEAYGTSYFGIINSTVSSLYNFDIPTSDTGKTCTLVFLFPEQSQLTTSSYTFTGTGGIRVQELASPAAASSTYDNTPAAEGLDVTLPSVEPGNSYVVGSHACGAGETIAFKLSATGSLAFNYFQDYSPSPIGLYDSIC